MDIIVYIAEKPSVAKAMAPVLGAKKVNKGYITNEDGTVYVTWLYGHVLELVDAHDYDPKYKKWELESLPIIPSEFKVRPATDKGKGKFSESNGYKRDQIKIVHSLIKKSTEVCVATDPDAEGTLLGVEVIEFLGYKGPLTRILPTSLDTTTILKCLSEKKLASESRGSYMSGLARSHIDWLVGINVTRGLTTYNRAMIDTPLNAGRVQTFIIGLLYKNHIARKSFKVANLYGIEAACKKNENTYTLKWKPDGIPELDQHATSYDGSIAESLCRQRVVNFKEGELLVTNTLKERKKSPPKLGFSLTDLQIECSKKLSLTASETLKTTQALYEAKLVTYPRSDCKYLPKTQIGQSERIIPNIVEFLEFKCEDDFIDLSRVTKTWNDSKIENHHGIMPTLNKPNKEGMKKLERDVYTIISKRYLSQFLPDHEYDSTTIEAENGGELFKVSGRTTAVKGWHLCEGADTDAESANTLPELTEGELVLCEYKVKMSKTSPPKAYNEGSLLTTLSNAYKLVDDKELSDNLKQRQKGIGTVATTGNIIEQMTNNKFICVEKKSYELTKKGLLMALIAPSQLLDANLTAKLDFELTAIEQNNSTYDKVVGDYIDSVKLMIQKIKDGDSKLPEPLIVTSVCPYCSKRSAVKRRSQSGVYWRCLECEKYADDNFGTPKAKVELTKINCKKCDKDTLTRYPIKGSKLAHIWYCTLCKDRLPDINEKPDYTEHKCLKCEGKVDRIYSKKRDAFFWICQDKDVCKSIFSDKNGVPIDNNRNVESSGIKCEVCGIGDINKIKGQFGDFWTCSNWKKDGTACTAKYANIDGKPSLKAEPITEKCPECKTGKISKKNGSKGSFWSCNNWNKKGKLKCSFSCNDLDGKPLINKAD